MSVETLIWAELSVSFQTREPITDEMAKSFQEKLRQKTKGSWRDEIYALAKECGFDANDFHPLTLGKFELILSKRN
jgi:hypothetical protein